MSRQSMTPEGRHPDEETLSAYWDRELAPAERSRVEAHLAHCEQCRRVLRGYERLSRALREEQVVAVPARLDHELRARLYAQPRSSGWALLPAVGSLAAAAVLLVFGSTLMAPGSPAPLASAYPARNATAVALTAAVEIAYPPGVDKVTVEQSVEIEPPVKVRKEWRGDTLVLTPEEPLAPATTYSVTSPRVEPKGAAPALPVLPQPTPQPAETAVVTTFTTAPVAVAQAPAPPERSPEPQPTPSIPAPVVLSSQVTPTPVAYPTPPASIAMAAPQASSTPAATTRALVAVSQESPLRDLSSLLDQPQLLTADLGKESASARLVKMSEQTFEGGRLLWREDERSVTALYASGRWTSFADTYAEGEDEAPPAKTPVSLAGSPMATPKVPAVAPAPTSTPTDQRPKALEPKRGLGKVWKEQPDVRKNLENPVGAERSFTGAVKPFDKGVVIVTDRRSAYVLYKNGRWQELAFFGTVATPVRQAPTVPVTPVPEATGEPAGATPRATPTAVTGSWADVRQEPTACPAPAARGLEVVYADPLVKARLGCPSGPEQSVKLAEQTFEGGRMLWRADTNTSYAITTEGKVHTFAGVDGEVDQPTHEAAPAGLLVPERGFGKVWRDDMAVREALGWATGEERRFTGAVQEYTGGTVLLWTDANEVLVVFADGRWEQYPDPSAE